MKKGKTKYYSKSSKSPISTPLSLNNLRASGKVKRVEGILYLKGSHGN